MFEQLKIINIPERISVDKNGFVYTASVGNNSVVKLSPDGKSHKTVLNKEDGMFLILTGKQV